MHTLHNNKINIGIFIRFIKLEHYNTKDGNGGFD